MTFGSSYWEVGKNEGSRNWEIPLLKNSINFKSMEALVFYGQKFIRQFHVVLWYMLESHMANMGLHKLAHKAMTVKLTELTCASSIKTSLWQSTVYNETSTNIECNCVTLIFLELYNHIYLY